MSQQLLNGCLSLGVGLATNMIKNTIANSTGHYRHNQSLYNYEDNAVKLTLEILLSDPNTLKTTNELAYNSLISMRNEVKKAFNFYSKKVSDVENAAKSLVIQLNGALKASHKKVDESVDKLDILADILLYRMVQSSNYGKAGELVYSSNFYDQVKKEVGKCGVELLKNSESPANLEDKYEKLFGKKVDNELKKLGKSNDAGLRAEKIKEYAEKYNEKTYGAKVDYRLEKLGYDSSEKEQIRTKLIEEAASNDYINAKDSVKFPLITGFFKVIIKSIENILETTAEIAIALLTGHVVDFSDIDSKHEMVEGAKLANDNKVSGKGSHQESANSDLIDEAEALREAASSLSAITNPYVDFDFGNLEGTMPNFPTLGDLAPSLVDDSNA